MKRHQTVEVFRERLTEVITKSGLSRAAFAARAGLDRSTLSQLLSPNNERLPRAETIAAIAAREQVSVDWLLGISQEGQLGAGVLAPVLEIESSAGSPADARLARWRAEAAGNKIRYVPTTLPDVLKTEEVIRYEYLEHNPRLPVVRIEQAENELAYTRSPETDVEVCSAIQSLHDFARGYGIWGGLPAATRIAQLDKIETLLDELYPAFRWFLYDGLQHYSVPVTVFGWNKAAIYLGDMYFVFNSTEHIRALIRNFDGLIRGAVVQPPDVIALVRKLRKEVTAASKNATGNRVTKENAR